MLWLPQKLLHRPLIFPPSPHLQLHNDQRQHSQKPAEKTTPAAATGAAAATTAAAKPRGAPPAVVDAAGVRHPANFFVTRRKPNLTGVLPVGTTDIAAPSERANPDVPPKSGGTHGAKKGWGKRSDRHGSRNKRR